MLTKKNNHKNENFCFNKKYIPFSLLDKLVHIKNYFNLNNFTIKENIKPMGSLEFGGLSNYWGLQIDSNINRDINHLPISEKKKLIFYFNEILTKFKFYGLFNSKNINYTNPFKSSKFINDLSRRKKNYFYFAKPILALFKSKKNKTNKKFISKEFFNTYLRKKKIIFHNYAVEKVFFKKKYGILVCFDGKRYVKIIAKKIIFGCGTLATTKLIAEALKIKKEIRIFEHPRYLVFFIFKKKIIDFLKQNTSQLNLIIKEGSKKLLVDFRSANKNVLNTLKINFKFMRPIISIINFFKNYMVFSNILIDSSYSNFYMKKDGLSFKLYEKKKNNILLLKSQKKFFKKIYRTLRNVKLIFPIYKIFFSKNGSSYHYFGTIPMTKNKKVLSTNFYCQLKKFKNIYIIDGSVINFKENKFPMGIIMANARRIAENLR